MHGAGAVFNGTAAGSTANISGAIGVYATGGPATVTNFGIISGAIGAGIALDAGGTVFDAGTIGGGNGIAVSFGGSGGSRLILAPSYVLNGTVAVTGTGNVLELAAAATAGTLSGFNLGLFSTLAVDTGASWALAGSVSIGAAMLVTSSGTIRLAGTLANAGRIAAAVGDAIDDGGVAATLTNTGTILAGSGPSGAGGRNNGGAGSAGGMAANLAAGGTFFSSGTVRGGTGGSGGLGALYGGGGGSGGHRQRHEPGYDVRRRGRVRRTRRRDRRKWRDRRRRRGGGGYVHQHRHDPRRFRRR